MAKKTSAKSGSNGPDRLSELESKLEALTAAFQEQVEINKGLMDEVEASKPAPSKSCPGELTEDLDDEDVERIARKRLAAQATKGEHAYRVLHFTTSPSGAGKFPERARQWANHFFDRPFRCDEPDPKRALLLYQRITGAHASHGQIELVKWEDYKPS